MAVVRHIVKMLGALPVPDDFAAFKNFTKAVDNNLKKGRTLVVMPEAHIWPYYTGIRPFGPASFRYPVRFGAPVFCTTTTYQPPRHGRTPRVTLYVDGPFYPDPSLGDRENERRLRDVVYRTMCKRAGSSSYAAVRYLPQQD